MADVESIFSFLPQDQDEKIPLVRSILPLIPPIETDGEGGRGNGGADPREGSRGAGEGMKDVEGLARDGRELSEILERIRFKMQDDLASRQGAEPALVEQMRRVKALAGEIVDVLGSPPEGAFERLAQYRARFREDLADTLGGMELEDMPKFVRDWFYQDGLYLLRIYPRESIWEQGALTRFVQDIRGVDPEIVGDPVSLFVFATAFKQACIKASAYALLAIFLLLALTFRRLLPVLLALLPLAAGTLWTVGVMGMAGVHFNLANSIFMPLVVGAGVEYGVVILHRWMQGGMPDGALPWSTGKGVILAALTTTMGFGALMISHHQGIHSLGFVAWAGSLCVLVAAVVLLPALLRFVRPPEMN